VAWVRDEWHREVPKKDTSGKVVKDEHGKTVFERVKTKRHPDEGGNKDAKRWRAVWEGTDGKEKSKFFAKQSDAQKYATSMEADALRGIRHAKAQAEFANGLLSAEDECAEYAGHNGGRGGDDAAGGGLSGARA
jgi:hypothetical protein